MHPNHMSDYIYCVYVSKMHRKRFFYEITTHLILFFEQTFPLIYKSLLLLFISRVHINIFARSFAKVRLLFWLILYYVTEFMDLNNL
jgi:hypothetical protein